MWCVWITCVTSLLSRLFFLSYWDVSFIMSRLLYQCFYYNNAFLMALKVTLFFGTFKLRIKVSLLLSLSLWGTMYDVIIAFFQVPKKHILNNIWNVLFTGTFQIRTETVYNYFQCLVVIFGLLFCDTFA